MEITVRTIENEADYEAALAEVEELMDAEPGTPEGARLDVLVTLIEAYEARHWSIDAPDPIEAIRVRMEQRNLRQRDLEPMIGSRGRVSEVLSRKRALTLPMIRKLARGLDLRADILIQKTPLVGPRRRSPTARGVSRWSAQRRKSVPPPSGSDQRDPAE
jgi:HTH-type transcriptional regulator / antitoxin HigA